jgi:catechol 2,3-dioxygenase-like lactoylglutathione lyase family enzyme
MNESNGGLIGPVDFIGLPTHDLATAVAFYGETLGLRRSVYMPDRNFAEFETDNLTINVLDAEKDGVAFFNDLDGNALMLHHRYAPRQTDG